MGRHAVLPTVNLTFDLEAEFTGAQSVGATRPKLVTTVIAGILTEHARIHSEVDTETANSARLAQNWRASNAHQAAAKKRTVLASRRCL
jgi:hypothetical protein